MYQPLTTLLLRWLRVPPEPQAPHGNPASLRVFRAGRNFFKLRFWKWVLTQVGALLGVLFWFAVFSDLRLRVEEQRARAALPPPATAPAPAPVPTPGNNTPERTGNEGVAQTKVPAAEPKPEKSQSRSKRNRQRVGPIEGLKAGQNATAVFLARLPRLAMLVIWFFEIGGLVLYIVQLPVTYLIARMDYELRWYMVTDRSLRIRYGVWKVAESTMSFANIQQVVVSQGPLQRLLGLADVKVQSAGGGSGDEHKKGGDDDLHLGLFHSVANAPEIRDLIQERLRHFRESGLGDPEEKSHTPSFAAPASRATSPDLLAATRDLATEVRALRGVREALALRPPT